MARAFVERMSLQEPDKTDLTVAEILGRTGPIQRTALVKMLYFTDLTSRWWTGRPITNLEYCFWDYGPYDPDFRKHEDHFLGNVETVQVDGPDWTAVEYSLKKPFPRKHVESAFDEADLLCIAQACKQYGPIAKRGARTIMSWAYRTRPMKKALKNNGRYQKLGMAAENFLESRRLGVSLQEFLDARRRFGSGKGCRLEDLDRDYDRKRRRTG